MASELFTVKVEGLTELTKKLGPDGAVPKPVKRMMFKLKNKAAKEAQEFSQGKHGTGQLKTSIKGYMMNDNVSGIRLPSGVKVLSLSPVARSVEEGRSGTRPSYRATQRWMKRAGLPSTAKSVRAMQQRLRHSRGVHFFERAGEATLNAIGGYVHEAEAEIKALWG